ncbi:MAG: hypothetical protein EA402_08145 [Planctomycetota bacterium]|nr:MAG: hypothetical protein EA402_08145 [Planctomycetota bacterium]
MAAIEAIEAIEAIALARLNAWARLGATPSRTTPTGRLLSTPSVPPMLAVKAALAVLGAARP